MVLSYWGCYYLVLFSPYSDFQLIYSLQYSLSKPSLFHLHQQLYWTLFPLCHPYHRPHFIQSSMVFLLLTFAKSGNSAGCLLAVSHILTKTQFLVCSRSRCHVTQWSLGICEGLVLGPPRTPKSAGAQAPEVYKMVTFAYKHCLHIGSNKVRLHITSFMWIQCSAWHVANLSFPFWNILWFFFLNILNVTLVESKRETHVCTPF